ncbi:flotillin family protein [Dongia sp.]|uniref:flotillin family protein n=1 Tax=Dongia sp. TaxID=1977262 RepID=UPI0034A477DA
MFDLVTAVALPAVIGLVAILAIGLVIARLYARAEKDRSYVRTGLGGQKVVLDGGSIVLPVFQSIRWVNLQTLRLDVRRENAEAMITKDRMRVDIGVEFYVRVKPDQQSIALAAQTLGYRTNEADQLRELVEAKFVDALRSVAATMVLADLQEKRADFVKRVQETVASELELNGLELESASLTKLDQTDTKYFNPNNAFDAEGLAALTKITEAKRQERNLTVRNAEVAIAQQDLEARQKTLEIDRQKKEAELSQERDIVNKTAETRAAAAQKEAEAQRAENEARITTQQAVALREAEAKQAQEQEQARIAAELAIQQRKIEADRTAETLAIGKKRDIELADQDRAIAVADRSRAESDARAEAEKSRALAIAAEESVATAQQVAIAERERQIAVLAARQAAEQEATKVTVQAQAERNAADDRAEAVRTSAKADSDAALIRAEAQAKTYEVEAEGQRKINEARNALSAAMVELEIMRERLRIIPVAIAESVRPLEKISDVRIIDMGGGLPGSKVAGDNGGGRMDGLMGQLLSYRANAPVIDQLLKEAGFTEGGDLVNRLLGGAQPVPQAGKGETIGGQSSAAE